MCLSVGVTWLETYGKSGTMLCGTYLKFGCSNLGDSSWKRTLSTLSSNE